MHSDYLFSISGLLIRLQLDRSVPVNKSFRPFLAEAGEPDLRAEFFRVSALPPVSGQEVAREDLWTVREEQGRFVRLMLNHPRTGSVCARSEYDWDSGLEQIRYLASGESFLEDCRGCFDWMALEALLMSRNRLILHAAAISTDLGGILFSGPSGIGKSTQAELWHQYEGASVINGDRPILCSTGGVWEAWGSPYAGSSGYHLNEKTAIRAIVLLEQGETCSLRRMDGREAFCALYVQTTFNSWDSRYVTQAIGLLMDLVSRVPVYCFRCTKDETAVRTLKQALLPGRKNG